MRLVSSGCLTVYPLGRWSSVVGLGLSCGWNFSTISAAATARNPLRCKGSASFRYTDVIAYQSETATCLGGKIMSPLNRPSPWQVSAYRAGLIKAARALGFGFRDRLASCGAKER